MSKADWDMSTYFSEIGSKEYQDFVATLRSDIDALGASLQAADPLNHESTNAWSTLLCRLEEIGAKNCHLVSYYDCMSSADALDETIKRDSAAHAATGAKVDTLFVAARAALGKSTDSIFADLLSSPALDGAEHFLSRLRAEAKCSMTEGLESLSAELGVNGLSAWGRLYDQLSGTLRFELKVEGRASEHHPIAMTRTLLEDADPKVRKAAFDGSAVAWESQSDSIAAAINAISGTRLSLYARRGVEHFLQPALFDAAIERSTLDCMFDVVRSRQSIPQEYLKHKASLLGMERLRFCDLMAPLPTEEQDRITWQQGVDQIQAAFSGAYPGLAAMTSKAIEERWVDHSPRSGKRPGGFCSTSPITKQSRIFMTYNGAMGDVQTLAHELGHTHHSYLMRDMRPWAVEYPMTLAETASTFGESLVTHAALSAEGTDKATRRRILDQRLQDSAGFMLNIPMRFDFESELYTRRADGEQSVSALKEMMLDAQRKNYGNSLDPAHLDPWFWASKLHFYITELSFYNFPYTFGYLFSMGIFARFLAEGPDFLSCYETLLKQTGSATAEKVALSSLGVEIGKPEFWNASIDLIAADLAEFKELAVAP